MKILEYVSDWSPDFGCRSSFSPNVWESLTGHIRPFTLCTEETLPVLEQLFLFHSKCCRSRLCLEVHAGPPDSGGITFTCFPHYNKPTVLKFDLGPLYVSSTRLTAIGFAMQNKYGSAFPFELVLRGYAPRQL
jgi:hypothetical protein